MRERLYWVVLIFGFLFSFREKCSPLRGFFRQLVRIILIISQFIWILAISNLPAYL